MARDYGALPRTAPIRVPGAGGFYWSGNYGVCRSTQAYRRDTHPLGCIWRNKVESGRRTRMVAYCAICGGRTSGGFRLALPIRRDPRIQHRRSSQIEAGPPNAEAWESREFGGEGGIRTHGWFDPSPVFKTGALNRSATSPVTQQAGRIARPAFSFSADAKPCPLRRLSHAPLHRRCACRACRPSPPSCPSGSSGNPGARLRSAAAVFRPGNR